MSTACEKLFNDRRIITFWLLVWTVLTCLVFFWIMYVDNSPFLQFGPNTHTKLFGVVLDSWSKWWAVTLYTFISTCVAAFASDSIVPFITNTIQDHKTIYIPYSKMTCLVVIQVFTCYSVVISIVGLFVALTQIDFTVVRLISDMIVNHKTFVENAVRHEWDAPTIGKIYADRWYQGWTMLWNGKKDETDDKGQPHRVAIKGSRVYLADDMTLISAEFT